MSNGESFVYVTEEGLEDIRQELEHLKTVKRAEVSERLERAISQGDISENADYDYAKQEQAFLEGRIKDLEDSLRRAKLIDGQLVTRGERDDLTDEEWQEEGKDINISIPTQREIQSFWF